MNSNLQGQGMNGEFHVVFIPARSSFYSKPALEASIVRVPVYNKHLVSFGSMKHTVLRNGKRIVYCQARCCVL